MQARSFLPVIEKGTPVRDSVFIQYDHQAPNSGTNEPARVHERASAAVRRVA